MDEPFDQQPVKTQYLVISFVIILFLIVAGGFIIFWLAYRHGQGMGLQALRKLQPPREEVLPLKYRLPLDSLISDWEYDRYSGQWAYALTSILESQYKQFGIDNKYLNSFEYISFSLDSILSFISIQCQKTPQNELCKAPSPNRAEDLPKWAAQFPLILNSIFPIAQCSNSPICTSQDASPIVFDLQPFRVSPEIRPAKQLLLETNRALAFTVPQPYRRYWLPCEMQPDSIECQNSLFHCPFNSSKYCFPQDYSFLETDFGHGQFPDEILLGNPVTYVYVAYNDNFLHKKSTKIVHNPTNLDDFQNNKKFNSLMGGFIVRNGLGIRGHSLEYLFGEISEDQERSICPNDKDPREWISVNKSCFDRSNGETIGKCSREKQKIFGKSILSFPTLLKCVDTNLNHCNANDSYYVLEDSIEKLENGMEVTKLIQFNTTTKEISLIRADWIPFHSLYNSFRPSNQPHVNERLCGYLFFSYDLMKRIIASETPNSGSWKVIDMPVQFTKGSYPSFGDGDYSYFVPSSREFLMLNVSQPFNMLDL